MTKCTSCQQVVVGAEAPKSTSGVLPGSVVVTMSGISVDGQRLFCVALRAGRPPARSHYPSERLVQRFSLGRGPETRFKLASGF